MNNVTEVFDSVKDRVECSMLQLVNDTTKALPDVLSIAEALNTVRNFSLNSTSEHTFKDLAHTEESEVDIRALHSLEVVHFFVFFMINLIKQLLPMVVEVEEKFFVVNHLSLTVK